MPEFEERTEQATPRRREKAREEGRIPRSKDLGGIAGTGGVVLVFAAAGGYVMTGMMKTVGGLLDMRYGTDPFTVLRKSSVEAMLIMLPFLGIALWFGGGGNLLQGGIVTKPLKMDLEKINPLNGLKNLFSASGLAEVVKSLVKFLIGGCLFYFVIKGSLRQLPPLMEMGISALSRSAGKVVLKAIEYGFACFFIVGIADVFLERWRYERSIRMTKEEVKDEMKESEGNPLVKSRVRSIQREMARKRMMQQVPKATVVITNPVHLAVALLYEDGKMHAPRIVAKGAEHLAERIKEVARRHRVPIVEDKPLARVLYRMEIGATIPEELYRAVAKILAYIAKLRERRA